MKCELAKLAVTFAAVGSISVAVSYRHGHEPQPTPGSKQRTTRATRMARAGLKVALEGLERERQSRSASALISRRARTASLSSERSWVETIDERTLTRREALDPDADLLEPSYIESVRRYHERAAEARRQQWIKFHECMSELHRRLSEEHAAKAGQLGSEEAER